FRTTIHRSERVLIWRTPPWATAGTTLGEAALRVAVQNLRPGETPQGRSPGTSASLLSPGLSAVGAAPDFVVTGGKQNLHRTACIVAQFIAFRFSAPQLNVSYVRAQLPGFDGRLYLHPGYTTVGGVEECARLPACPYILVVTRVAQQWMIAVQSVLPTL